MDPQATFRTILDALDRSDDDTLDTSMRNLRDWLSSGGTSPIVTNLGYGNSGRRRFLSDSSGTLTIQTANLRPVPIYEFVAYDEATGEVVERFPLISG